MGWEDTITEDTEPTEDWEKTIADDPDAKETTSPIAAIVRGGVQGISGGYGDELAGAIGGGIDYLQGEGDLKSLYEKNRDEQRAKNELSQKEYPKTYTGSQVATSIIPTVLSGGASIPAMTASGAAQGLGYSEADLTKGDIKGAAKDAAIGGTIGGVAGGVAQGVSKLSPKVLQYLSGKLGKKAEDLAVNATGGTGRQVAEYAPGTGRYLLDTGKVKLFDTAEDIAMRTGKAMEDAGKQIGSALDELDNLGTKASVDNVRKALLDKADELAKIDGNQQIVNQLRSKADELINRGESNIPISFGEKAKVAHNKQVNSFSPESDKNAAYHISTAYRKEVERAAEAADNAIAKKFMDAKKEYNILAPVEEAASKRALTQSQSPFGGLGDMVATTAGGVPGVAAKRLISPRLASTAAVSADKVSKALSVSPEIFGKYAKALTNAAAKGSANLMMTHQILQKDHEYQKILDGL